MLLVKAPLPELRRRCFRFSVYLQRAIPHVSRKVLALKRFALLACLLSFMVPVASAAQTPVAIEGLQVIAERQYAAETDGNIDTSGDGAFLVSARVYVFDDADAAESTWETLVANETVEQDLPDDDSVNYEKVELDDIGDRAMALSLEAELAEGDVGAFRTVIAQRDAMIVSVNVVAGSPDGGLLADELVQHMIERDPADSESEYDGTGGSTGGVWDVFPATDSDMLQGLKPYADKETRPSNG